MLPIWITISQKIDQMLIDIITGDLDASVEVVDRLMELKAHIQDKYLESVKKGEKRYEK
jgi:hypothetical protein